MNIVRRPIEELRLNPDNPRYIKEDKYKKLLASIREFPEMLDLRPIVVDSEGIRTRRQYAPTSLQGGWA